MTTAQGVGGRSSRPDLAYAHREPALFTLMFQFDELDTADAAFATAAARALTLLLDASEAVVDARDTGQVDREPSSWPP